MSLTSDPRRIGSFAIEDELSVDELGAWFRARDERLDRVVALRVWRLRGPRGELRPLIRARALAAAAVAHPNLPTVFERDELGVTDLLSVEFIGGASLAELLANGHLWRPLDAARIVMALADALAVAHAADLAHGSIAPERVRLAPDGRPVLLGLGVARSEVEARAPVGGAEAKRADVAALAGLITTMCGEAFDRAPRAADPMLTVEANLLEPILVEAVREKSRRLTDAAALRDALVAATTPGGALRRSQPPAASAGPRTAPAPARAREPRRAPPSAATVRPVLDMDGADEDEPEKRTPRPAAPTHSGNLSVLLPVERGAARPKERRPVWTIAAGLVLGALLASGGLAAWRAGLLPGSTNEPAFEGESSFATAPPPSPPGVPADEADGVDVITAPEAEERQAQTPVAGPPEVDPQPTTPPPAPPPPPPPPPPPAAASSPPAPAGTRTAGIAVTPADAVISRADNGEYVGLGSAEISVARGDSVVLELSRQGYVRERRVFRGAPLNVTMRPDSVDVTFIANVPVEVVVDQNGGQRVLGTTPVSARMTSGEYRVRYRSPVHEEWSVLADFPRAGSSYRVSKMDYPTRGAIVIAVEGGWARVSVNGGPERETPARFDDLPTAPHIVRLSREGFQTIVDTVEVTPGQVLTRQYQMRPAR